MDGHEWQDDDSPSFYNDHEAIKIVQQVRTLIGKEKQLNVMFNAFYGTNIYYKGQIVAGHIHKPWENKLEVPSV